MRGKQSPSSKEESSNYHHYNFGGVRTNQSFSSNTPSNQKNISEITYVPTGTGQGHSIINKFYKGNSNINVYK